MSIASKIDSDCLEVLYSAPLTYTSENSIGYDEIVKAVDLFEEESEFKTSKVMFVHPKQVTQIRLDDDFRDINKYPLETMMSGTIGEVAGCLIVPSKKVVLDEESDCYINPIVITSFGEDADDVIPALTIYLKRDILVETDRDILAKTHVISADEHYTVALSNDAKVVLAKLKA